MIIQSKNIWINENFIPAQIEIIDGVFNKIFSYNERSVDKDYEEAWILPGFIDIHTHGYMGMTSNQVSTEGLKLWTESLPREGVTSFLVTTSTAPISDILKSMNLISSYKNKQKTGSKICGIHHEGTFLNPKFKGAQNEEWLFKPNIDLLNNMIDASNKELKIISCAIELDEDFQMCKFAQENNIVISVGHSAANIETVRDGHKYGVKSFTHTFNGMHALHHREVGTAGAALRLENMYAELIGDGVHVNSDVAHILAKAKGKDKLILVTDAVQIKGLKPGHYSFFEREVTIGEDGCGRLADGRLAGSSNKMNEMMNHCIEKSEIDFVTVINAATKNPARLLNLEKIGEIKENFKADFVVSNNDFEILETFIEGEQVYAAR